MNSTEEQISGTVLDTGENRTTVSFDILSGIEEILTSVVLNAVNCAGGSSSEPIEVGKVLNYYTHRQQTKKLRDVD